MNAARRRTRPARRQPRWFIVRRGRVQYVARKLDGTTRLFMPLFMDRELAVRFAREYLDDMPHGTPGAGGDLRVAEIGSLEGETLAGVLAFAAQGGAEPVVIDELRPNGFLFRAVPVPEGDQ